MVSKNDHGKKANSTTLLYSFFNEEVLADHLISEDSPTKKKRNAERFFDLLRFVIFIESIKLHEDFIAFLKAKKERLDALARIKHLDVQEFLMNVIQTPIPVLQTNFTLAEQKQQLKSIEMKFQYLIAYLNSKITKIDTILTEKRKLAAEIKTQSDVLRQSLVKKWQNHFQRLMADPDILFKLTIPLPINYQTYLGEMNYEGEVYLRKSILNNLEKTMVNAFESGKRIQEIHPLVKETYLTAVKDNLLEIFAFIPATEREQFVDAQLQEPDIQKNLKEFLWHDILHDPDFKEQLLEDYKLESKFAQTTSEIADYENCQNQMIQMKSEIDEIVEKNLAEMQKMHARNQKIDGALLQQMNGMELLLNQCFDQANISESILNQELEGTQALSANQNDFFEELAALETQVKNKVPEGISAIEEQSMRITLTSIIQQADQSFMQPVSPLKTADEKAETMTQSEEEKQSVQAQIETPSKTRSP